LFRRLIAGRRLMAAEMEADELRLGVRDREFRQFGDVQLADWHREDLGLEAGARADRARDLPHVALVPLAGPVRLGLGVLALDEVDDALEPRGVRPLAPPPVPVADVDLVVLAVQHGFLRALRELAPRDVD